MGRLDNKAAFVTGAGGGIAGAIARRFAAEGARVAVTDVDLAAAARTVAAIEAAGGEALALRCDVANSAEVQDAIGKAAHALGGLDVLVNAAANDDPTASAVDLDEAEWQRCMAVNLTGVFLVCKYGIPHLVRRGGGSVVIVASQLGQVVVPRRVAYVTCMAALIQLAR